MESPNEQAVQLSDTRVNTVGIKLKPEVLRIINYNYDTLYAKIETTAFMCPELRRLLDHCKYLHETTNESLSNPYSPRPVMYTLFLLEDALDRKLTLEDYNDKRKRLLGNGTPWMAKLGLLIVIVGAVLAAAGLFLISANAAVSVAVTNTLLGLGGGLVGGGASWCFFGRPDKVSRLADDLGPVLYNAMSAS
jgi:hypothetical protein